MYMELTTYTVITITHY